MVSYRLIYMICDTHTHFDLPLKAAGTAGTCTTAGGEDPAAFLAMTEMLTAENET